ncbi:MAG TPA: methyltransferase domain-containing protein [Polyangiaceae bacterium]|nr:methyltransferase domain-containing protein [Polyangiaceae bacterium]
MTSPALPYGLSGRDEARAYFDWIVGLFGPALAGDVLDHGAGTGALAARLADRGCRVFALEPDAELMQGLAQRFRDDGRVTPLRGTIETYLAARGPRSVDAVISSNVLEHVEDDVSSLKLLYESLRPGGALAVYVPARRELFGSLDASVGHLRRYSRSMLRARLEQAGFFVQWVRYGNLAGALPWLVAGRVLKRPAISGAELGAFDRWVFPVASRLEALLPLPYGLNLAALARRQ